MRLILVFLFAFHTLFSYTQSVNPTKIDIVRDTFGVPHIFAKTNVEAVYGLAWAQCEDNFKTMQELIALSKGMNGELKGKEGAVTDFIAQMFEVDKVIDARFDKDISPEFHSIMRSYLSAFNHYAETHAQDILVKKLFPVSEKDALKGFVFNFLLMNHAVVDIAKVFKGKMDLYKTLGNLQGVGSNAMAYSPNKTADGKTYLVANPHQPIDGIEGFYEVAIYTDEGWNVHGATFLGGGMTPLIGTNNNLGWTHTTNYDDYADVFRLTMHPSHPKNYRYDGQWKKLTKKQAHLRVRLGKIILPITKTYYTCEYGPVIKNKEGYFALRNNAYMRIGAAEQWYRMNLARNFDEFWKALLLQQIPCQTVTYADKEGNILHIDNATMPIRDPHYEWRSIVPGDTSATLWSLDQVTPLTAMPYIKNPTCGYLFNCNNTPFDMTAPIENLKPENYSATFGILKSNTPRANRFKHLIQGYDKVSFADVKRIRDDDTYQMDNLNFRQCMNLTDVFRLDTLRYPDLKDIIAKFRDWDGKCDIHSKVGSLMSILGIYISDYLGKNFAPYENRFTTTALAEGMRYTRDFFMKNYGTLDVELGTMQKLARGGKELPMYGGIETIACCTVAGYNAGKVKMVKGDSFIMYAKYGTGGLEELKTTNSCGNSSDPNSPHYNDQMELFANKLPKTISMDKTTIYKQAVRISHPE